MYHSTFSAVKDMSYIEKHGLFPIAKKLLSEICINRPIDVRDYIARNVKRISIELRTTQNLFLIPTSFDMNTLTDIFKKSYNIPIITYTKARQPNDTERVLRNFQKFLKHYNLEKNHRIFINFPRNNEEAATFKNNGFNFNSVVEIRSDKQECHSDEPYKCKCEVSSEKHARAASVEFKEVENYFQNAFRVITMKNEKNVKNKYISKQTTRNIGSQLIEITRNLKFDQSEERFCQRVVIYGRRGSGRTTQGLALAKRFNLVFVNAESLLVEYLKSCSPISEALRSDLKEYNLVSTTLLASLIYKRILEKDAVTNGYVIVGFPYNLNGFQYLKKFTLQPNKIIFLHCRKKICLGRLIKRWKKDTAHVCRTVEDLQSKDNINYVNKEMEYFDMQKSKVLKYLSILKETIHIDGNHSYKNVRRNIFAKVEQNQIQIGMAKSQN